MVNFDHCLPPKPKLRMVTIAAVRGPDLLYRRAMRWTPGRVEAQEEVMTTKIAQAGQSIRSWGT